ncbi:metal ABC transporter permease [Thermocrinis minervae]|uniref:Zinc transport system permease protein n=1 Tax=Thermocrinis minervae TaxID=381751 RepID=A0A1M6S1R3_9AQUI|nr:metal ABC transporter permease [Thermocrinis minervae]SHK38782.1 zinc transport system permease protein [Thermocrinis minervae]
MSDLIYFWQGIVSAILVSVSASFVGVYLTLRRLSMLGASISHFAFSGIAIAIVMDLDPFLFTLLYVLVAGLVTEYLIEDRRLPADTVLSLIFSFGVALSIVILGLSGKLGTQIVSYLFGSLLTTSTNEVLYTLLASLLTIAFLTFNYRRLMLMVFSEDIAKVHGIKVRILNYMLVALACINIVLSMKALGLLLATSFISIPPLAALMVANAFLQTIVFSILFSLIATLLGIFTSFTLNVPPSGSIVMFMVGLFVLLVMFKFTSKVVRS